MSNVLDTVRLILIVVLGGLAVVGYDILREAWEDAKHQLEEDAAAEAAQDEIDRRYEATREAMIERWMREP